jgi:hypothetical protein
MAWSRTRQGDGAGTRAHQEVLGLGLIGLQQDEKVCAKSVNLIAMGTNAASQHLECPGRDFANPGQVQCPAVDQQVPHRPHCPRRMAHSSQMRPLGDLHIWRAMPPSGRDKTTIPPAWTQAWAKVWGTGELPAGLQAARQHAQSHNTPQQHRRVFFILNEFNVIN